jgi:hypothetical protein
LESKVTCSLRSSALSNNFRWSLRITELGDFFTFFVASSLLNRQALLVDTSSAASFSASSNWRNFSLHRLLQLVVLFFNRAL